MNQTYNLGCMPVNNFHCLTVNNSGCSVEGMTLGQRLQIAMEHARLNQVELAARTGVKQQVISKIIQDKQAASAQIVRLAMACGVRSEWLAEEQGEMVGGYYVEDQRLVHLLKVCEALPGYAVDHLVRDGDEMAQLIKQARKNQQ